MAMDFYCNTVEDLKCRGRAVITVPVLLFSELYQFKQDEKSSTYKQKDRTALRDRNKLAIDRIGFAGFTKELSGTFEGFVITATA
jgi:hypothetical protein